MIDIQKMDLAAVLMNIFQIFFEIYPQGYERPVKVMLSYGLWLDE
jgi:hypothetical protein